jgi:flavin reductase (DIM6/NTAB) family NADH-FMN oxidoreductase RutF
MKIEHASFASMPSRHRATLINSLAGIKQAVLVGTSSPEGRSNLAIFNSLIHIGANPPMYGLLFRPDTVRRDTLSNILSKGEYTLNYVRSADYKKAHQTSAKYDENTSEFTACGFEEERSHESDAPFVKDAVVKIRMKFEQKTDIPLNGTILIIGSVREIIIDESLVGEDGFVSLFKADPLLCSGLDAYYRAEFIGREKYAEPGKENQTGRKQD